MKHPQIAPLQRCLIENIGVKANRLTLLGSTVSSHRGTQLRGLIEMKDYTKGTT